MIKKELSEEEIVILNALSIDLYNGATGAYDGLERMRLLTFNLRLECGRIADMLSYLVDAYPEDSAELEKYLGDARALKEVGKILEDSITNVESATMGGRDVAKSMKTILHESAL